MNDETPEFPLIAVMKRDKSHAQILAEKVEGWKNLHSVWTHHCEDMPEPWYALAVKVACEREKIEPATDEEIKSPGELIAGYADAFEDSGASATGPTEAEACHTLARQIGVAF